jgi:membrane protease YdiL (CAAX protease family)
VRRRVEALSPGAEFAIVILGAFGLFIFTSALATLLRGTGGAGEAGAHITEPHLEFLLVYELAVMAALAKFLAARGWTVQRLGLRLAPLDVLLGLGLAFAGYVGVLVVSYALWSFVPQIVEAAARTDLVAPGLRWRSVVLVSIVNGIFEEVFVVGYVMSAVRERTTLASAVSISTGIRLLYHFYQGTYGVLTIVPIGVLMAWFFGRTGRLWPAIVAHAIYDFYALSSWVAP